jgi:DNA-directed RNA polymerase alpha subunit
MKDFEIRCDESRLETTNLIYGKFTLGPFLPGQATTFGNALRRSLLAELSGLAITAFEIIGVMQEFSTLPGLRESILDLSLNLKQIVLTGVLPHSTPPIGFLNVRGPAIIKAIDLKLPAGVYCASPNQYIATLGSNGMLHLKFIVSVGKGYSIQPYSIYRSLSKIRLQPASNFDNTVVDSDSLLGGRGKSTEVRVAERRGGKQMLTPFTSKASMLHYPSDFSASLESVASDSFRQLGAKDLLGGRGKGEMSVASDSGASSANPDGAAKRRRYIEDVKAIPSTYQRNLTPVIKDEKGFFSKASESTAELYTKGYQRSATDSTCATARSSASLVKEPIANNLLLRTSASKGESEVENLDSSQSTFFTNEQKANSSYINIQTQLFQRITPHQVLPIDAVFTPVSQVNFLTEVNDRFETARENIVLEIWTNGSIHPKQALEEATLSLVQNFDTLLKKIQQTSSFYKGLRYWTYLQPFKSSLESPTQSVAKQAERQSQFSLKKPSLLPRSATQEASEIDRRCKSCASKNKEAANRRNVTTEGFIDKVDNLCDNNKFSYASKERGRDLPESIYNLDVGNLNLSLQTFIFLKKAKIHTLLQLLTQFSPVTGSLLTNINTNISEAELFSYVSPHLPHEGTQSKGGALTYQRSMGGVNSKTSESEDVLAELPNQRGKGILAKLRTKLSSRTRRGEMNVASLQANFAQEKPEGYAKQEGYESETEGYRNNFYSKSKSINYFNKESKSNFVHEKIVEELNNVIKQFGSEE